MDIKADIEVIERKIVALEKAQSELKEKLERLKIKAAKPASPVRRNLKAKRIQEIENFYTKRQLNKKLK
ncbi:MAG TPA: hypothetical protein VK489_05805 [Ferruginibacter sp.]|nr:hypothetical protein [Ferruginibacter sp.]